MVVFEVMTDVGVVPDVIFGVTMGVFFDVIVGVTSREVFDVTFGVFCEVVVGVISGDVFDVTLSLIDDCGEDDSLQKLEASVSEKKEQYNSGDFGRVTPTLFRTT